MIAHAMLKNDMDAVGRLSRLLTWRSFQCGCADPSEYFVVAKIHFSKTREGDVGVGEMDAAIDTEGPEGLVCVSSSTS